MRVRILIKLDEPQHFNVKKHHPRSLFLSVGGSLRWRAHPSDVAVIPVAGGVEGSKAPDTDLTPKCNGMLSITRYLDKGKSDHTAQASFYVSLHPIADMGYRFIKPRLATEKNPHQAIAPQHQGKTASCMTSEPSRISACSPGWSLIHRTSSLKRSFIGT